MPVPVPLLDLKAQYQTIRDEVDEVVREVIESQYFVMGPNVDALEAEIAEYLGVPHAIGCASGTDALLLPMRAIDPQVIESAVPHRGDDSGREVILPAFTFFATAGAVWNAGFTPVFCDVDPVTFNVTRETLEAVWTEEDARGRAGPPLRADGADGRDQRARPRAGRGGDRGRGAGNRGSPGDRWTAGDGRERGHPRRDLLLPDENLGGFGDGGMITTDDAELAERLRKLRGPRWTADVPPRDGGDELAPRARFRPRCSA